MPTTYAHWTFGQECLDVMPPETKKIIEEHRDLYDIGVHGPDIFFYDLTHSEVKKFGRTMHWSPARPFFENAAEVYKNNPDKDEMLAYILGFLTHFTFDSQAHGYVDRKKEVDGITHNKVESEYDGYLMRKQGKKVTDTDRSISLRPNKNNARIIARFFPFDEKVMLRTCRGQHRVIKTLNSKSDFRYRFLTKALDLTKADGIRDLPVNLKEADICRDSNLRMEKLQKKALHLFPSLYANLMDVLKNDAQLIDYFDHDFEAWEDYKDIPILSYEDELNYKV